jgi:NADH dehydrogenase
MYEKKKIVILGAGYAGVMAAVTLPKKVHFTRVDVTLVNNNDYQYLTTKVHENGAGTIDPEAIKLPIKEIVDTERVNFIQDEVVSIDKIKKTVTLKNTELTYDYLLICIGGVPKTFHIPGLKEHAFFLTDLEASNRLREHIENQFIEYNNNPIDESRLTFVICGAGFTGIEFYFELTKHLSELAVRYAIPDGKVKLKCVDAASNILMGYDDSILNDVVKLIESKHLDFQVNSEIQSFDGNEIVFTDGTSLKSHTLVWAGGVTGHPLLEQLGAELIDGRVKLNEYLEVPGEKDIYVLGDASVCFSPEGIPYPPSAQIAIQQGQYVGYHISTKIYGTASKPFRYIYRGTVLSLGKGKGAGIVYGRHIRGRFAAFMKNVIEMRYYYLIGGLKLVRTQRKKVKQA